MISFVKKADGACEEKKRLDARYAVLKRGMKERDLESHPNFNSQRPPLAKTQRGDETVGTFSDEWVYAV